MNVNKIKLITQMVGLALLALLATYGVIVGLGGTLPLLAQGSSDPNVPTYVNYQGILKDPLGELVTGVYTMTVSVYDYPEAGSELWWEEHISVTVREGRFSVILGDGSNCSGDLTPSLFSVPERYIALTVDGVEMEPRQRFVSVPYAFQAWQADQADHANQADHAYGLSAADGDPMDAVSVDNGGNVGVGTTAPKKRLHVDGDYYGRGHIWLYATNGDGLDGSAFIEARDDSGTTDLNLVLRTQNAGVYTNSMILKADGNVSVGAGWSPQAKLDVDGDLLARGDITANGDIAVTQDISADGDITANGDIATDGNITATNIAWTGHLMNIESEYAGFYATNTGAGDETVDLWADDGYTACFLTMVDGDHCQCVIWTLDNQFYLTADDHNSLSECRCAAMCISW